MALSTIALILVLCALLGALAAFIWLPCALLGALVGSICLSCALLGVLVGSIWLPCALLGVLAALSAPGCLGWFDLTALCVLGAQAASILVL